LKQWIKFANAMNDPNTGTGLYKQKTEYFRYRPHSEVPYERGIYLPELTTEEVAEYGKQVERNDW